MSCSPEVIAAAAPQEESISQTAILQQGTRDAERELVDVLGPRGSQPTFQLGDVEGVQVRAFSDGDLGQASDLPGGPDVVGKMEHWRFPLAPSGARSKAKSREARSRGTSKVARSMSSPTAAHSAFGSVVPGISPGPLPYQPGRLSWLCACRNE